MLVHPHFHYRCLGQVDPNLKQGCIPCWSPDVTHQDPSHKQYGLKRSSYVGSGGWGGVAGRLLVPRLKFQVGLHLPMGKRKPICNVSLGNSIYKTGRGWYYSAFPPNLGDGGASRQFLMGHLSDRHPLLCCMFTGGVVGSPWSLLSAPSEHATR